MGANEASGLAVGYGKPQNLCTIYTLRQVGASYALFFFTICCGVVFVCSSFYLSNVAFYASMPVLVVLAGYSLMKRIHYLTFLSRCLPRYCAIGRLYSSY